MSDDIVSMIEKAVAETKAWSTKGWLQKFGSRKVEVTNLQSALDLPDTFVYKLEAVAYWNRVNRSSLEAADWGERALEAARKGNLKDAEDKAYYARFVEHPMREQAPVWGPVFQALQAKNKGQAA